MRCALGLLAAALAGIAQAATDFATATQDPLFGEWWTPGFSARVRIVPCQMPDDGQACGVIVWLWDEAPRNIVHDGPLLGRTIFAGFARTAPGQWANGRIYNPEDGVAYAASLSVRSPDVLVVNGCVLFFCKTQVWRRHDAVLCPPAPSRLRHRSPRRNEARRNRPT